MPAKGFQKSAGQQTHNLDLDRGLGERMSPRCWGPRFRKPHYVVDNSAQGCGLRVETRDSTGVLRSRCVWNVNKGSKCPGSLVFNRWFTCGYSCTHCSS